MSPTSDLLQRVCRCANALKKRGVKKGDRVVIYMPMSIEGIVAMQACARIGATHSVVFGGFSSKSLNERIVDVGATALITCDEQMRGGKALAAEEHRRRSARRGRLRSRLERDRLPAHRRQGAVERRSATCGCMKSPSAKPIPASRNGSGRSIRSSSCTRPVRPARRRACSTAPAASCSGPRRR